MRIDLQRGLQLLERIDRIFPAFAAVAAGKDLQLQRPGQLFLFRVVHITGILRIVLPAAADDVAAGGRAGRRTAARLAGGRLAVGCRAARFVGRGRCIGRAARRGIVDITGGVADLARHPRFGQAAPGHRRDQRTDAQQTGQPDHQVFHSSSLLFIAAPAAAAGRMTGRRKRFTAPS